MGKNLSITGMAVWPWTRTLVLCSVTWLRRGRNTFSLKTVKPTDTVPCSSSCHVSVETTHSLIPLSPFFSHCSHPVSSPPTDSQTQSTAIAEEQWCSARDASWHMLSLPRHSTSLILLLEGSSPLVELSDGVWFHPAVQISRLLLHLLRFQAIAWLVQPIWTTKTLLGTFSYISAFNQNLRWY